MTMVPDAENQGSIRSTTGLGGCAWWVLLSEIGAAPLMDTAAGLTNALHYIAVEVRM